MGKASAQNHYSPEDVDHALQAAAIADGNVRKAGDVLRKAGFRVVPRNTLHRWITSVHLDRYRELQDQMGTELNRRRADEHESLAAAYRELQWEVLEQLREKVPEMKANELIGATQKFAISMGIHIDKARLARNEPTQIHRAESTAQVLAALQERFPHIVKVDPGLLETKASEAGIDEPTRESRKGRAP